MGNPSIPNQSNASPTSALEELPAQNIELHPILENNLAPESSEDTTSIPQVTSVSALTDVQPTDWAFRTLQSLVERYGCIAGYPDRTYRGNRAINRYEFAAGLNQCLERVRELITAQSSSFKKEDLAKLQKLQEEFAAELSALRGRVDALEEHTATIQAQQFSTTTKLSGEVLTYLGDAFGKNADRVNNTTFAYVGTIKLNTSFTGKDLLVVSMQGLNIRRFDPNTKFPKGSLSGVTDETRFLSVSTSGNGELLLNRLSYRFPVGQKLLVVLDAFSNDRLLTAPISSLSDSSTGAVSYFGGINPMIYPVNQQSGVSMQWQAASWLNFDFSLGSEGPINDPSARGIFKGGYGASVRPVITLGKFKFGASYINSYSPQNGIDTASGSNAAKVIGAGPVVANTYAAGFSYLLTQKLELGSSAGYSNARALGKGTQGDAHVFDYRINLVIFDLVKKGNLGGLIFGMQPRLTGTSNEALATAIGLPLGQRSDRNVGFHVEAFYTHRFNDNITITPGIFWLTAPNHDERNPSVVVGVIRTSLSF